MNTLLDVRTKHASHLSRADFVEAKRLLKAAYVKCGVQHKAYTALADASAANVELVPEPAANLSPSAANLSPPNTPPAVSLSPPMSPSGFAIGRNPHSAVAAVVVPIELTTKEELGIEFETSIEAWLALNINWTADFPELQKLGKKNEKLDLLNDLLPLDLGPLYERFCTPLAAAAGGKLMYGFIPFMALANLGSDLAASYVERVNSAAKDCMPEGSTLSQNSG